MRGLREFILAALAIVVIGIGYSTADYLMNQGTGTSFGSGVVSNVHYARMMLCDQSSPTNCVNITGASAIKVDGSAATQPISGNITNAGTFAVQLTGATNNINNISGTVSLPTGASTAAKQPALGTAGAPSADVITVQAAPNIYPFNVNPATPASWGIGTSTQNSATVANGILNLGQFNTTPTSISSGNMSPLQMDANGNLLVNIKAGAAAGGTSSNFGSAFPSAGTAVGAKDSTGTNMAALNLDASGFLKVNVAAGGGSGGTALADNSAFTQGSTNETPVGCIFVNSYATPTSARSTILRCDNNGGAYVNLNGVAGQFLGAPSLYGTSPGSVTAIGVNAFVTNANANGQATMANSSPVVIASNQTNLPENLAQIGGTNFSLGQLAMASSISVAIASNQSNVPENLAQIGGASYALGQAAMASSAPVTLASNQSVGDPCTFQAKSSTPIAAAGQLAQILVPGVSAKRIYVCTLSLVGNPAATVSLIEGTGATCGTSTAAVMGGTTAASGMAFAANGGLAVGGGMGVAAQTATNNNNLCLIQSATPSAAGNLIYVQQ